MNLPTGIALVAMSVLGLGSLAYLIFRKDKEDDEDLISTHTSRCSEVEVRVPKDSVGIVIGRQGSNIKEFETLYSCKINFADTRDTDAEYRICRIRGDAESVKAAEAAIHAVIANQPLIESFEMKIPGRACGKIIGRGGENIRSISLNSNAKITISRSVSLNDQRVVVIKGTSDQIAAARALLNQKLIEVNEFDSLMEQGLNSRSPRHTAKFLLAGPANGEASNLPTSEKLVSTGSDGLLEVFTSALESPDRMWLQMKGPSTVELDRLNETMTAYYSKPESRIINAVTDVRVGQLVAAPFTYDNKYYRAEINEIIEAEEGELLDLYYVDYGDSAHCSKEQAFQLRPEFLKLRFQAIECILARVKPRDDEWPEEALDLLEQLTHVALWKPLTARIHSYKERPTRARRDGSPVPCVDLYDTSGPHELNVAQVLVERGFADWDEEKENSAIVDEKPTSSNGQEDWMDC